MLDLIAPLPEDDRLPDDGHRPEEELLPNAIPTSSPDDFLKINLGESEKERERAAGALGCSAHMRAFRRLFREGYTGNTYNSRKWKAIFGKRFRVNWPVDKRTGDKEGRFQMSSGLSYLSLIGQDNFYDLRTSVLRRIYEYEALPSDSDESDINKFATSRKKNPRHYRINSQGSAEGKVTTPTKYPRCRIDSSGDEFDLLSDGEEAAPKRGHHISIELSDEEDAWPSSEKEVKQKCPRRAPRESTKPKGDEERGDTADRHEDVTRRYPRRASRNPSRSKKDKEREDGADRDVEVVRRYPRRGLRKPTEEREDEEREDSEEEVIPKCRRHLFREPVKGSEEEEEMEVVEERAQSPEIIDITRSQSPDIVFYRSSKRVRIIEDVEIVYVKEGYDDFEY